MQMVALNAQTDDKPMRLNRAWFARNGACGYVPKPRYLLAAAGRGHGLAGEAAGGECCGAHSCSCDGSEGGGGRGMRAAEALGRHAAAGAAAPAPMLPLPPLHGTPLAPLSFLTPSLPPPSGVLTVTIIGLILPPPLRAAPAADSKGSGGGSGSGGGTRSRLGSLGSLLRSRLGLQSRSFGLLSGWSFLGEHARLVRRC